MKRINQRTNNPRLRLGESVIIQAAGSYKHNWRSGWKVARCFLTNQRLIMYQRPVIGLEIPVHDITGVGVERLHYVLRKRECLSVSYNAGKGSGESRIWFITNDLDDWMKRLTNHSAFLKVDSGAIEKVSAQLDSDCQDILWYLWERRHARIDQLAELIDARNHMDVLLRIRETINPIAERVIGCPVLIFERSKVDPETGEAVLFSWWLAGQPEERTRSEDRLLDIFDEGSYIQVIIEVRGVKTSDVRLEVSGDELSVRFEKDRSAWKEVIQLPAGVDPENYQMHLKNNLLEVRLSKG